MSAKFNPPSASSMMLPTSSSSSSLSNSNCSSNQPSPDDKPNLTLEEAQAIRAELSNIQKSLYTGEQEKVELMKSLACLKDDLIRLQHSETSLDVMNNPMEKFSTASQTDLSGEVRIMIMIK